MKIFWSRFRQVAGCTGLIACAAGLSVHAQTTGNNSGWLDLADLGRIEITTVSKRPESVWSAPAAVTVVTGDDISRVGATSIPEALQWVPGLNVAQINSNTWAIGARGFQWQHANKLLVMIDGRPVYSLTSGGVRWEDNTTFLDDIDRIEVVRGPGSSIWGANAVNGVIDIVTRSAFDTPGTHVIAASGVEWPGIVGLRHGIAFSDTAAMRVYGQYRKTNDNLLPDGNSGEDAARLGQGGFRFDWKPTAENEVTVQGDVYSQRTDYVRTFTTLSAPPTYTVLSRSPIHSNGANVLGRWRHSFADKTYLEWQSYWDHIRRDRPQDEETLNTVASDLTLGVRPGDGQEITAGIGYRWIDGDRRPKLFTYVPRELQPHLFSTFIQDEITLVPDRWVVTLGTKLEHNTFTGWELQPSARVTFTPTKDLVWWSSVARAVRTPTWGEETSASDARVFAPGSLDPTLPTTIRVFGNPDLKAERLTALEAGARWKLSDKFSLDAAVFSYDYDDYVLVTFTTVTQQTSPPAVVRASQYKNGIKGESYGGELALRWSPTEMWQLFASYSYVNIQLHTTQSDPFSYEQDEGTTPRGAIRVQSSTRFGEHWELNVSGRHVDRVPYYSIPAYSEIDARLNWKSDNGWQVALVGRNLLNPQHLEYDSALQRKLTAIQRSVFVLLKTDF